MGDGGALDLGRADALAGDLERDQYASSDRSGSFQKPRVMPGMERQITSSPTAPRTGRPASSTTSAAVPMHGPENDPGLMGPSTFPPTMPPDTSVPPL